MGLCKETTQACAQVEITTACSTSQGGCCEDRMEEGRMTLGALRVSTGEGSRGELPPSAKESKDSLPKSSFLSILSCTRQSFFLIVGGDD